MMKAIATIGAVLALCLASCNASCGDDDCISDPKLAPTVGLHPGRFAGKVCFITGATSGLGEHAAYHLAQEGCAVVVTGRREEKGAKVVKHIESLEGISTLSPPAMYIKVDVTDYDSVAAAAAEIKATYGRLDAVFANAGVAQGVGSSVEGVDPTHFKNTIDINVLGVFHTIKASAPLMKASGGGSMVLCSSIYGLRATPMLSAYITSKHAVEGLKSSAGADLFQYNIRVNNLNPSFTPSEMTGGFMAGAFREKAINVMQVDNRMSELGETSSVTAYLLSSDSQYINGQSMAVGAGMENNLMNPNSFRTALGEAFAAMGAAAAAAEDEAPKEEL